MNQGQLAPTHDRKVSTVYKIQTRVRHSRYPLKRPNKNLRYPDDSASCPWHSGRFGAVLWAVLSNILGLCPYPNWTSPPFPQPGGVMSPGGKSLPTSRPCPSLEIRTQHEKCRLSNSWGAEMGTHPLQGDSRELTMVGEPGFCPPGRVPGRPQCQRQGPSAWRRVPWRAWIRISKRAATREESRGVRGRKRGNWVDRWAGEEKQSGTPVAPRQQHPASALGTAGKKPASRVRGTKLGFKRRLPGTSLCKNAVVDRKTSCHGSHRQAQFFL